MISQAVADEPVMTDMTEQALGPPLVEFSGHIITQEGIQPCPNKVAANRDFPRPRNSYKVAGFLCLAGYYCKFIRGFGEIARLLDALKKQKVIDWGWEEQRANNHLKVALTSNELLAYLRFDRTFLVTTDTSKVAIGGVVSQ
ncbi:uncharacterized protein [Palaemon carinicauda]|uniref:uncharacterized protein n=1 Tax=Palaemon carinicauda TaxID=392227 RepID=UPI0035B649E6